MSQQCDIENNIGTVQNKGTETKECSNLRSAEEIYDFLLNKFGKNEPIFMEDFENYNIDIDRLQPLLDDERLKKYLDGVYFIPTDIYFKDRFLGKSTLDNHKVVYRYYLTDRSGNRIGTLAGFSLINGYGVCTQVPNTIEVFTNKASEEKIKIKMGWQTVWLYKPKVKITNDNWGTLTYLEILNELAEYEIEDQPREVRELYNDMKVKSGNLRDMLKYFPKEIANKLELAGVVV